MKTVMSSQEVTHAWAHRRQDAAHNSRYTLYLSGDTIYSYGTHFPIARHLDGRAIAVTTQRYSSTTASHVAMVRKAIRGFGALIFVSNPRMSADASDRGRAEAEATKLLSSAAKRRSPALRDGDRAGAMSIVEQFNTYAEAVGSSQRIDTALIASADLAALKRLITQREEQEAADRQRLELEAGIRLAEQVKSWRDFGSARSHEIRNAPTALRVYRNSDALDGLSNMFVETSHGAIIPAADAIRLWPIIRRVMAGERDYEVGMPLGAYRLTRIYRDGSIVVGCHDIAFAEIERIAERLGLVQTEVAA